MWWLSPTSKDFAFSWQQQEENGGCYDAVGVAGPSLLWPGEADDGSEALGNYNPMVSPQDHRHPNNSSILRFF